MLQQITVNFSGKTHVKIRVIKKRSVELVFSVWTHSFCVWFSVDHNDSLSLSRFPEVVKFCPKPHSVANTLTFPGLSPFVVDAST